MKIQVTIQFHGVVRRKLQEWIERRSAGPGVPTGSAEAIIDLLRNILLASGGFPDGFRIVETDPLTLA